MKKVLFVATVVKSHIMVFHLPYLKWFKENGYEVHVCARNDYENKEECVIPFCDYYYNLPFERFPIKFDNYKTYKHLKAIINNNDFEIIHCHTPTGGAIARLAAQKARKKGTRLFYTAHGFHFFKGAPLKNWLIYYPVERVLAKYTDVLITITKEDYNRAEKSFNAGKVEYIPGVGVDTKRIHAVIGNKVGKRLELGIPDEAFIILSIGELNKNKNHETVIMSLSKLDNSNFHYIICGQGSLENHLRNLVLQLGLEKQVHLLGFRNDIDEICKAADVFVFLSYREGLSVALMEAMTSGLPVICSNIRGNTDLVEKERGGYFIDPNDVDNLVDNIVMLKKNRILRTKMGQYNAELMDKFGIEKVRETLTQFYKS